MKSALNKTHTTNLCRIDVSRLNIHLHLYKHTVLSFREMLPLCVHKCPDKLSV